MDKRRAWFIAISCIVAAMCTGCKNDSTASQMEQANKYSKDKEIIEYTLDRDLYIRAIEDLLIYDGDEINLVKDMVNRNSDILTEPFIELLISRGQVIDTTPIPEDEQDDFIISDEDLNYGSDQFIDNTDIDVEDTDKPDESDYEIVEGEGTFGSKVTGATEEADADRVDPNEPVYSVMSLDAYNDKLIASVKYKYGDPLKVWIPLEDNKIAGYIIYR